MPSAALAKEGVSFAIAAKWLRMARPALSRRAKLRAKAAVHRLGDGRHYTPDAKPKWLRPAGQLAERRFVHQGLRSGRRGGLRPADGEGLLDFVHALLVQRVDPQRHALQERE
jgi:hypothetical protein